MEWIIINESNELRKSYGHFAVTYEQFRYHFISSLFYTLCLLFHDFKEWKKILYGLSNSSKYVQYIIGVWNSLPITAYQFTDIGWFFHWDR